MPEAHFPVGGGGGGWWSERPGLPLLGNLGANKVL